MTEAKHTPTPWYLAIDDEFAGTQLPHGAREICCVECSGLLDAIEVYGFGGHVSDDPLPNARFIVEAVNSHSSLTAENARLRSALEVITQCGDSAAYHAARAALDAKP